MLAVFEPSPITAIPVRSCVHMCGIALLIRDVLW